MKHWWLVTLSIFGLSGCVGYGGVFYETVYTVYPQAEQPERFATDSYRPPVIDSLKPTFRWRPVNEPQGPDDRYDILIHEAYRNSAVEWAIGREVYYRLGLDALEHTLEIQLEPDRAYYWAVRIRRDEKPTSEWSRFVYLSGCTFLGSACSTVGFPFFLFITPAR